MPARQIDEPCVATGGGDALDEIGGRRRIGDGVLASVDTEERRRAERLGLVFVTRPGREPDDGREVVALVARGEVEGHASAHRVADDGEGQPRVLAAQLTQRPPGVLNGRLLGLVPTAHREAQHGSPDPSVTAALHVAGEGDDA